MASVAALIGHDLPNDAAEDSVSLLPTLLDPSKSVRQDLIHHSRRGEFAIRDGDWKLITDSERKPMQLFNIANDLAEKNNVYEQHPEVVKRLAAKLEEQCESGRSIKPNRHENQHIGSRKKKAGASVVAPAYAASVPKPTRSDVPYGKHDRHVLDFWKAPSDKPTPLAFVIHGGGWKNGSKERLNRFVDANALLNAGISVVAINYRYIRNAQGLKPPVKAPLHDAARALQFVRSKADEWNIDKTRIAATGGSAGACSSLWLLYHDDLADPQSEDPVARESTRLTCAAVNNAQTTLDPQQMKEWTPNSRYGGHAFGIDGFDTFLAERDSILPWIAEYSPYALVSTDDPPVGLFYKSPPALGGHQKDPTHTANFGVKLQERCEELGGECELVYPGASRVEYKTPTDYLIVALKAPSGESLK
jgi:acetyl esterase/lipase